MQHDPNILTNSKRSFCSTDIAHMRCATQLRPTLAWRRTISNALRTLPKSRLSSGVLSRFQDQTHPCLHVLAKELATQSWPWTLTLCSVMLQRRERPDQKASISYGVFLDTAPGPSKLHFYIFFGRQPDKNSSDHRSCARTGEYDRPCCRCDPPNSNSHYHCSCCCAPAGRARRFLCAECWSAADIRSQHTLSC